MRNNRKVFEDDTNMKIIRYVCIGVGILAVIVLGLLLYSKGLNDEVRQGTLTNEQFAELMNNTNSANTESASTEIGKSVNEASNELSNSTSTNSNMSSNTSSNVSSGNVMANGLNTTITQNNGNMSSGNTNANAIATTSQNTNSSETSNTEKNANAEETKKELSFAKPVEGEIMKEFAQENLIYSQTLEEWTTHTGIDIKAEKTTVVKAAEAGMVKTIKNDPRYGLTIVIEHENGFETVYSNLLTSEFVVEGEKVEKGQSLGTVGNTAAFEIADEPHLHFEILKDSVPVDPSIYIGI